MRREDGTIVDVMVEDSKCHEEHGRQKYGSYRVAAKKERMVPNRVYIHGRSRWSVQHNASGGSPK